MIDGLGRTSVLLALGMSVVSLGCGPNGSSASKKSERAVAETSPSLSVVADRESSRSATVAKQLYLPIAADFRSLYDKDLANKAKQEWHEYYSWVTTFYSGNLFESGWTKRAMNMLDGLRSEQTKDELRASLNEVSKMLAGEWAKDNGVRKVDNSDLRNFGARFLDAKARDDGSGTAIRKEIAAVRAEIEARFRH